MHPNRRLHRRPFWVIAGMLTIVCVPAIVFAQSERVGALTVHETFRPGNGLPIGGIRAVEGRPLIVHTGVLDAYIAAVDLPLFQKDVLVTREDGRMSFQLNDGSFLSMAQNSKMTLDKSVYDPDRGERSSYVTMGVGKARFMIRKLADFKRSDVKVRTNTAIIGVRGSDFLVFSRTDSTQVIALDDTELSVVSLTAPDVPPTVLRSYQRTVVEEGALPTAVESVTREEMETMLRQFIAVEFDTASLREAPEIYTEGGEEITVYVSANHLVKPAVVSPPESETSRIPEFPAATDTGAEDAGSFREETQDTRQDIQEDLTETTDTGNIHLRW
jgi:hypothetical protein